MSFYADRIRFTIILLNYIIESKLIVYNISKGETKMMKIMKKIRSLVLLFSIFRTGTALATEHTTITKNDLRVISKKCSV